VHCNYCGRQVHTDDVVRTQRIGFSTDNDEGLLVEVERFVSSATCECGAITEYELNCADDLLELEAGYDSEQTTS
jgi:hypothetical protein